MNASAEVKLREIKKHMTLSVRHFYIDHNAPCLPPKILHNYSQQFTPGCYSRPKRNRRQWLCKILRGKQRALWS